MSIPFNRKKGGTFFFDEKLVVFRGINKLEEEMLPKKTGIFASKMRLAFFFKRILTENVNKLMHFLAL